jgi:hypothetical protein
MSMSKALVGAAESGLGVILLGLYSFDIVATVPYSITVIMIGVGLVISGVRHVRAD